MVHQWYGWQTLCADAGVLSVALMVGAGVSPVAGGGIGAAGYLFGGPVIHAVHSNWGRSAASLGLRLALPALGALIGSGFERGGFHKTGGIPTVYGLLVGGAAGVAMDAGLLAHERVPIRPKVVPAVGYGRDGGWLGFAGAF